MKKIIVAIDGYSSCGKSTLAKALAKKLRYIYIDSGAMYRAVTLYFLRHHIYPSDEEAIAAALQRINIHFENIEGQNHTFLNGEDVEATIRTLEVSNWVSEVAAIPAVRRFLVEQQQAMGARKGIVMDGRDIGTVVFPNAELKIFLTADPEIRAQRRFRELQQKGRNDSLDAVRENLSKRDYIDTHRKDSPLTQALDAHLLDNSHYTPEEQLSLALEMVQDRVGVG